MLDMDVRIDAPQEGSGGGGWWVVGGGRARQTKEAAQKQMCDAEKVDFAPLGLD